MRRKNPLTPGASPKGRGRSYRGRLGKSMMGYTTLTHPTELRGRRDARTTKIPHPNPLPEGEGGVTGGGRLGKSMMDYAMLTHPTELRGRRDARATKIPHPNPLPEGEGMIPFIALFPGRCPGLASYAPLALESPTEFRGIP